MEYIDKVDSCNCAGYEIRLVVGSITGNVEEKKINVRFFKEDIEAITGVKPKALIGIGKPNNFIYDIAGAVRSITFSPSYDLVSLSDVKLLLQLSPVDSEEVKAIIRELEQIVNHYTLLYER